MDDPNEDDPIVSFRKRKNQLALIHRDLALNAEGIRICNLYEKGMDACMSLSDVIHFSLLCNLHTLWSKSNKNPKKKCRPSRASGDYTSSLHVQDIPLGNSSSSESSRRGQLEAFVVGGDLSLRSHMTKFLDSSSSDYEDVVDKSITMSDMMSDFDIDMEQYGLEQYEFEWDNDNCSDTSDSDVQQRHCTDNDYEEILISYSLLIGCTLSDVHELCKGLIDVTAIRQSEWDEKTKMVQIPKRNRLIDNHTDIELMNLTRFNRQQLHTIKLKFFGNEPGDSYTLSSHRFTYEETLLIALAYMANAEKYSSMHRHFGGDWQAYTYPINWFANFIFVKYHHRITGSSMEYWASSVPNFRSLIWSKVCRLADGTFSMPLEEFYNYGFIDCISHETCSPASGPINNNGDRHENRFEIQRAFYTKYGKKWGFKTQGIVLPNGMIGNAWCCSVSHNDKGVVNLSGVEEELVRVLQPYKIGLQFPTLYADEIYEISQVINKRNGQQSEYFKKMSRERQNIEHLFGATVNLWKRLTKKYTWKILSQKASAIKHVMSIWFMMNVYTCLNGNKVSVYYNVSPPSLDDYLANIPVFNGNPDEPDVVQAFML